MTTMLTQRRASLDQGKSRHGHGPPGRYYYRNERALLLYHASADCSFKGDSFAEVVVREGQGRRHHDDNVIA